MEQTTMSSEELAKQFSGQQSAPQAGAPQSAAELFQQPVTYTSEELAANPDLLKKNPQAAPAPDPNAPAKTEAELEEEKKQLEEQQKIEEAKKNAKPKLDETFVKSFDEKFIKSGMLQAFGDGTDEGYRLPETWEDVTELIEANKEQWISAVKEEKSDDLLNEILASKSPAFQFLIQHADSFRSPQDLVPLLTSVQAQEDFSSLDVEKVEDQIKVIKASLAIQGIPPEAIESEIEDLKDRNKLADRAKILKPALDKFHSDRTQAILAEKAQEDAKENEFWTKHYSAIEEQIFKQKEVDGLKLKNEDKQFIASLIVPDQRLGGLPIYAIIDKLVGSGDVRLLGKIALLAGDEKKFDNYYGTQKKEEATKGLRQQLRSGVTSNASEAAPQEQKPTLTKTNKYGWYGN